MKAEGLTLAPLKRIALVKAGTTTFTVPTGHRYYLAGGSMQYTASAAVATRVITVYVNDGTVEHHLVKFDCVASQVMRWLLGADTVAYAAYEAKGTNMGNPKPMIAGDVLNVSIAAADAGDTWNATFDVWDIALGA